MGKQLIKTALLTTVLLGGAASRMAPVAAGQQPEATFRSNVDLVRVAAVVRDRRGRFVRGLHAGDFEVLDNGRARHISDFRLDNARISIALVFDVSGSMEGRLPQARETASHVLSWLNENDEVGVFTFDTRLDQVTPFQRGLRDLPPVLSDVTPFGATSLHDAIAETAERLNDRDGLRRAILVFTDGVDNASRLTPSAVSGIASTIDVPVYVLALVPHIDNPASDAFSQTSPNAPGKDLADLAAWTGGQAIAVSNTMQRSQAARRVVDELRHQYLIAFESSGIPGWRPLVVRMRDKDLTVRARSGYIAGQSRPISQ